MEELKRVEKGIHMSSIHFFFKSEKKEKEIEALVLQDLYPNVTNSKVKHNTCVSLNPYNK